MSKIKSFLRNFKFFFLKLATKAIFPQYLVFPTFFSEIYIHYAGKLFNTRGRSAALYLHQFFFNPRVD